MSVTSGLFNSVNGDRVYNADDLGNFFEGVLDDGVFRGYDDALTVSEGSGMTVHVGGGKAFLMGKYIKNTGVLELTVQAGGSQPRYDAVVCGVNLTDREADIYIKKGTEAANPAYPALISSDTVKELCLAYIYVSAGASSITASNITDKRSDEAVCGYAKFTNLSAQLTVLRNHVPITSDNRNIIEVGISEYDMDHDTLMVYLNGMLLTRLTDYQIGISGGNAFIQLAYELAGTNDNWVDFVVYKMVV